MTKSAAGALMLTVGIGYVGTVVDPPAWPSRLPERAAGRY